MNGFNKVMVIGNLAAAPELKYTQNGTALAKMRLGSNRKYSSKDGEKREDVLWINCVAWGKTAEICGEYLDKGSAVHIEGRLSYRQWESPSGEKRNAHEIVVESIIFLSGKRDGSGPRQETPKTREPGDDAFLPAPDSDDNVPF